MLSYNVAIGFVAAVQADQDGLAVSNDASFGIAHRPVRSPHHFKYPRIAIVEACTIPSSERDGAVREPGVVLRWRSIEL